MNSIPKSSTVVAVSLTVLAFAIAALMQATFVSPAQAQTNTTTPTTTSTVVTGTLTTEPMTTSTVVSATSTTEPTTTSTVVSATSTTEPTTTPIAVTPTTTAPSPSEPTTALRTDIGVSGTGRVNATPDTAIASVGVEITAPTLEQATEESRTTMTAVLDAIREQGVADEDIQTTAYNIFPITNQPTEAQAPTVTAYRVNNLVTIKIRDIDDVSAVLDAALAAGANSVNSVSFVLDDPTEAQNQARTLAVQDAMAKAASLAAAAGVEVGPLVSISELPVTAIPFAGFQSMPAAGGAGPIETGTTEVIVTVELHFEIAD